MLKIYICEDDTNQLNNFKNIVKSYLANNINAELELATNNPYDILKQITSTNHTGIYFLDIDLNTDINGIELAAKIREHDINGFIVFITTHSELRHMAFKYKVEALDYILKDNFKKIEDDIISCIDESIKRFSHQKNENEVFIIKKGASTIKLDYNDIIMFETSETKRKIYVHTSDRKIEFYSELKEIDKNLNDDFFRCHKSYIINKRKVKEIDKKLRIIHLENSQQCLCARKHLNSIVQKTP